MLLAFSLLFQKKYISVALLSISFLEFILAHSTIRNYIFNQGKALIATCIYSICNTLWGAFPLEKKPCHWRNTKELRKLTKETDLEHAFLSGITELYIIIVGLYFFLASLDSCLWSWASLSQLKISIPSLFRVLYPYWHWLFFSWTLQLWAICLDSQNLSQELDFLVQG